MIAFVFPGQGSQRKGMGQELFGEFQDLTAAADKILGYSIERLCREDPDLQLNNTQFAQPALYVVSALSYLRKVKETGKTPDYVAGHSLGEYSALFAAGCFDFETGLRIVKKRGELMSRAVGGGMAAVIGLTGELVAAALKENELSDIDIANYNSPLQVVISGPKSAIDSAKKMFESRPNVKMVVPLQTSGAFHSRYMENAQKQFSAFLEGVAFSRLTVPVLSNVNARPYKQEDIKQNLIAQITNPVQWTQCVEYLLSVGKMEFEEIGPGRVLTGLIQRIKKESTESTG